MDDLERVHRLGGSRESVSDERGARVVGMRAVSVRDRTPK